MHPGRVSTSVRIIVGAYTAYAVWMAFWVADQSERLATILPAGWTVAFWLAAWVTMAGIGTWAAISGKDCPVRVALVLVAALSAASLLAVVADTRPLGTQFWPVGEAVVNIVVALALLNSPLRPPVNLRDHELDQGE